MVSEKALSNINTLIGSPSILSEAIFVTMQQFE